MSTILTGIRSNDTLHLGIYLGAIKAMVDKSNNLDSDDKMFFFLPDLHSFTTPIDHESLYDRTIDNVRMYLAAGLQFGDDVLIYRQSQVQAHSEMAWILSCFTYYGEANRMVEFKDKSEQLGHKGVSVGLLNYPILMAGDILLYGADYIPVGEDQRQHLELTRTLADRLNNKFDLDLATPKSTDDQQKYFEREQAIRIRSLTNPQKKMSKSVEDEKGKIELTDDPKVAAKKIMSAETDSVGKINYDFDTQPGISNLLQIEAYLTDRKISEVVQEWQDKEQYGDLKKKVAATVESFLTDFQTKYNQIDDDKVMKVLEAGEEQANKIANKTLLKVQKAVGLRK